MNFLTKHLRPIYFTGGQFFDQKDFSGFVTAIVFLKQAFFLFLLPITFIAFFSCYSMVKLEYQTYAMIEIIIVMPLISVALSVAIFQRIHNCCRRMGINLKEIMNAYKRQRKDEKVWEPKKGYIEPVLGQYSDYNPSRQEKLLTQKIFILNSVYVIYLLLMYNFSIIPLFLNNGATIDIVMNIGTLVIFTALVFISPYYIFQTPLPYDANKELSSRKKYKTALLLAIFLGWLGIDRFYLGYLPTAIFKALTFGLFGTLWLLDIYNIATSTLPDKIGLPLKK